MEPRCRAFRQRTAGTGGRRSAMSTSRLPPIWQYGGRTGSQPPEDPAIVSKSATISMVVAAVVVIAAAAALVFVRIPTTTSGQALPVESAARTTSAKPNDPLQPKATGGPQVAGWQPIPISNGGALDTDKAYDVPQGWSPIGGGLAN